VAGKKFNQYKTATTANSVFTVSLIDGEIKRLFQNKWGIDNWYTDNTFQRWLGYKYEDKTNYLYTFEKDAQAAKVIIEQGVLKNPDYIPLAIDAMSNKITMLTREDSNTNGIYHFDLDSGKAVKPLYNDPLYDVSGQVLLSKNRSQVLGVHYQQDKGHSVFFDDDLAKIYQDLSAEFSDSVVQIIDFSSSRKQVIFYTYADRDPGKYYYYDAVQNVTQFIGSNMGNLSRSKLAKTEPISFSSDEQTIHGYITLPNGGNKDQSWPMVVMPHGGPYLRDIWAYDHYLQFLANRGFAVLQVNFRSSTGYGLKHYQAGIKQYGAAPIDDLIQGVHWSIKNYPIDEHNICVFGASYGGYAALTALTMDNKLFKCGVVMSGFGDLEKLLNDDKDEDFYDFEVLMMGDPDTEKAIVRANSPIYDIEKLKAPIFVIHGRLDGRVKYHHAQQIIAKLKQFNKSFEAMLLPDEGHSFIKRRNQKNLYKRLNAFLSKHIANKE
jgi:dipeptidyl aminopeptidase/acylaminoacyl peptidase